MAPAAVNFDMMYKTTSLAVTPLCISPLTLMRIFFGLGCMMHCEASTISTSEVPMPKAIQPNAPWVEVWESPQTMVMPGRVMPFSGPTTCTIPFFGLPSPQWEIPCFAVFSSRAFSWLAERGSCTGRCWLMVGVLWSAVAKVLSGNITLTFLFLSPRNATGLVTSWMKWRSIRKTSGPSWMSLTTCASHTLSNRVVGLLLIFQDC